MRFAAVATLVTALASAPFVAQAAGAKMSEDEFVQAAQCLAYNQVSPQDAAEVQALKGQVAFEQLSQPRTAVLRAQAEIRAIGAAASEGRIAHPADAGAAVCGQASQIAHANGTGHPA